MQSCLTFDKKFDFDWWCDMMNVPLQKRVKLTECMMKTSVEMQEFFNIQYENNKITSFYTEMALFVCKKFNIKKINFLQSFQSTLYLVTEKMRIEEM